MKRSLLVIMTLLPFLFAGNISVRAMDERQSDSKASWLGVTTKDITPRIARSMQVKTNEGALVTGVMEDSPAEEAGIKEEDIITEFNGTKIIDGDELREAVRKTKPGTTVTVVVSRNDQSTPLKVTVERAPRWFAGPIVPHIPAVPHVRVNLPRFVMSSSINRCGLWVRDLHKQLATYFGAPGGRGVLVEEVEEGSTADSAGFKAGDVIVKVQNDEISRIREIWDAFEGVKEGGTAAIEIIRKGIPQKLSLRVDESHRRETWFGSKSFEIPEFDSREFRQEMQRFKEEMRKGEKELESQTRELKNQLREELNQGNT
jgi:serine protease Do